MCVHLYSQTSWAPFTLNVYQALGLVLTIWQWTNQTKMSTFKELTSSESISFPMMLSLSVTYQENKSTSQLHSEVKSMRAQLLSHIQLFTTLWTIAHQTSLFMGFPREKYRSGLPFPTPGNLSNPMQKAWVWSLGQEDPLGKEMATLSSILAWEMPWTEEPGGLLSMGSQKSQIWLSD